MWLWYRRLAYPALTNHAYFRYAQHRTDNHMAAFQRSQKVESVGPRYGIKYNVDVLGSQPQNLKHYLQWDAIRWVWIPSWYWDSGLGPPPFFRNGSRLMVVKERKPPVPVNNSCLERFLTCTHSSWIIDIMLKRRWWSNKEETWNRRTCSKRTEHNAHLHWVYVLLDRVSNPFLRS